MGAYRRRVAALQGSGPYTMFVPQGHDKVRLVGPGGVEVIVQFPAATAETADASLFTPEVQDRINRWRQYDPASPAPVFAERLVREFGYEVQQPPKSGAELRFVVAVPGKGAATLWMNTTGLHSIAAQQTDFAARLQGAQKKEDNRVVFLFNSSSFDFELIVTRFKEWAEKKIY